MTGSDVPAGSPAEGDAAMPPPATLPKVEAQPEQDAAPGTATSWKRYWPVLAVCAAVVLAIVAAEIFPAAGSSGSANPAAGTSSSRPAGSALNETPASLRAEAGGKHSARKTGPTPEEVVSEMRVPKKLAAALTQWQSGPGGHALSDVTTDAGSAAQILGRKLYAPARATCVDLEAAVTGATAAPKIPDPVLQKSYARALAQLAAGAAECKSGIVVSTDEDGEVVTHQDLTMLASASANLTAGAENLYQAATTIKAAGQR
jgi:flagellar motor protein MotB